MKGLIELTNAIRNEGTISKIKKGFRRFTTAVMTGMMTAQVGLTASADDFDSVKVSGKDANAGDLMGKVLGILLTITRYVGVALVIYGVYEIVMSFMQNQPEAKTKGIIMALAGVIMIALKSVLKSVGVIG